MLYILFSGKPFLENIKNPACARMFKETLCDANKASGGASVLTVTSYDRLKSLAIRLFVPQLILTISRQILKSPNNSLTRASNSESVSVPWRHHNCAVLFWFYAVQHVLGDHWIKWPLEACSMMTPSNWKKIALLAFVRGIHRLPVNSPHKGQSRGALMFSLICSEQKVE